MATQAMLLQLYVVKAVGVHAYEMPLERYQYFSRVRVIKCGRLVKAY